VLKFENEKAISVANNIPYGLTSPIYTKDADKSSRTARKIDAGIVSINHYLRSAVGTPFRVMKER
jgi:acyl-CoA reductase-like NAD-dependent aldehyde dehydrogenase